MYVMAHIEDVEKCQDRLLWVDSCSPLFDIVTDDTERLYYDGGEVFELYEMDGCGTWIESYSLYRKLIDEITERKNKCTSTASSI